MSTSTDRYADRRQQALDRANEIRLARAELKRRIARGEVSVVSIVLDPPPEAEGWAVGDAIGAQHRWGSRNRTDRARVRRLLIPLRIRETKPLGSLTARQRQQIASALHQGGRG